MLVIEIDRCPPEGSRPDSRARVGKRLGLDRKELPPVGSGA